jgi:hypothetical protein
VFDYSQAKLNEEKVTLAGELSHAKRQVADVTAEKTNLALKVKNLEREHQQHTERAAQRMRSASTTALMGAPVATRASSVRPLDPTFELAGSPSTPTLSTFASTSSRFDFLFISAFLLLLRHLLLLLLLLLRHFFSSSFSSSAFSSPSSSSSLSSSSSSSSFSSFSSSHSAPLLAHQHRQ